MTSLSVLFEQPIEGRDAAEALGGAGPDVSLDGAPERRTDGDRTVESLRLHLAGMALEVELVTERVEAALLDEAVTHAGWAEAAEAVARHRAQARIRATGAAAGNPVELLGVVSRAAGALLRMPGALALLDEEGRALSEPVDAARRLAGRLDVPPLDLWVAVRAFQLADAQGWFLDTIGMSQFGLPDLEAYSGDGREVADWLRNVSLHLVQQELPLHAGDTLDGPDEEPWITVEDAATVEPARRVLRFAPV